MLMETVVVVAYYILLAILSIYGLHRLHLVRLLRRAPARPAPAAPSGWPSVTIQLPLFNEPHVAGRLIDACAAMQYPGPLEIQVLDDSNDATADIVAERVVRWRQEGVEIHHLRRNAREGYKAGALAAGLTAARCELLAIFDADFVPRAELLREMVPYFGDPEVGMVQARWTHLNRQQSVLTRVQAIHLDSHFGVESSARHAAGRFFNFNGTAGIWRKRAVVDSGGWSSSTVTEDLDLSYRAQLGGWKFVFLPEITVEAELPATLSAFNDQQHRWVKGSIQTARRIIPAVLKARLPLATKIETVFHLTNNSAYLITLLTGLLLVPSLLARHQRGLDWMLLLDGALFASSTASVLFYCAEGQRRTGGTASIRDLLAVLPVGIGMSVRNSSAVLEGLIQTGGHFARTPKQGSARQPAAAERAAALPTAELVLAGWFAFAIGGFMLIGAWLSLPFLLLFFSGYGTAAILGFRERLKGSTISKLRQPSTGSCLAEFDGDLGDHGGCLCANGSSVT
jgi:glycosyltransferase involved in cell wall biosynthesis